MTKTTATNPKPHSIEDVHYADALWEAVLRHRHNPVVAQRLAQLEATVMLVEEDSLQELAQRKQELSENMWNPVAGFRRGVLNTVVAGTGTGKSMWGSKHVSELYQLNTSCPDATKKGQR